MVVTNSKQEEKQLESKIQNKTGLKTIGSCSEIRDFLSELQTYDKKVERSRFLWVYVASLGGLVLLGAVAWGFWESTAIRVNYTPMILLGVLGLIWLVAFGLKATTVGTDVEDRRYELAESVLNTISRDIAEHERIELNLRLHPVTAEHNLVRKTKGKRRTLWSVSFYSDQWMQLRGTLLDGTKFSLAMTETRQDRQKHSRSGKLKQKNKGASEVALRLKFKAKRYPNFKTLDSDLMIPKGSEIKKTKVDGERISITAVWHHPKRRGEASGKIPTHDLAGCASLLFLGAYRSLNAAKG